ncbi:DoxX family protein [Nocardia gipuzkoensis]
MTEQDALHTMKTTTATAEKSGPVARSDRTRIRALAYWATTFVIVFELVSGSVWNLLTIEWIEIQLQHLRYPHFFAYILGVWQVGAAVAIIAPGFALIKEWAYTGAFLLWSGAVVSHLAVGDGVESWSVPLMFAICAIASWKLRPLTVGSRRWGCVRPALLPSDKTGPVCRRPALAAGPLPSGCSLSCMPFHSSRCPRSKTSCTTTQLSSAGFPNSTSPRDTLQPN